MRRNTIESIMLRRSSWGTYLGWKEPGRESTVVVPVAAEVETSFIKNCGQQLGALLIGLCIDQWTEWDTWAKQRTCCDIRDSHCCAAEESSRVRWYEASIGEGKVTDTSKDRNAFSGQTFQGLRNICNCSPVATA
jgi:hypothetical protein